MLSNTRPKTRRHAFSRIFLLAAVAAGFFLGAATGPSGAARGEGIAGETKPPYYLPPVRTDSPRHTFATFLRLRDEMEAAILSYTERSSFGGAARISLLSDQMVALIDLEFVPRISRREVGIRTYTYLMDIFGRIGSPDPTAFPDAEKFEAGGSASFIIPETPIRIVRIAEGERKGEFLFSPSTVQVASRFFSAVRHLPLDTRLDIESHTYFGPQLTGPLVPASVVRNMPPVLTRLWLDTPFWKILAVSIVVAGLVAAILLLQRILAALAPATRLPALVAQAVLPLAILATATVAMPYVSHQVNVSGRFAAIVATTKTTVGYVAYAWLFWLGARVLFEWIIRSPRIPEESLDANLLRLVSGTIGILGVTVILAFGGQAIGLPIMSVVAGLGIGGLAVALALRPTLENLVGGVMLYIDRPVRVGDFCSFGNQTGTVEGIGIRSTKLRALDRTVITVPNAQFADMQIVNWAECDQMLINETIGIRYETTPDQLRFFLSQIRRMLHAHPRINSDTVRVRFTGYGESALNINIRVYAGTREWNDFFAIREDVFLRICDLVEEAGTSFAFPSQTLYIRRDGGLDTERGKAAEEAVKRWRKAGRLPFPRLPRDEIERLDGTLDYPPYGSPEAGGEKLETAFGAEHLSAPQEPTAPEEPVADGTEGSERRS